MEVTAHRDRHSLRLGDGTLIRFPAVMGVLNVTPDSFSDGGRYLDPHRAVEHALEMEAAGAAIIDIGGESTRPRGAREIATEVEIERIAPVLKRLQGRLSVPISIDTRKAAVARVALDAGAAIVNDVSALGADPAMAPLAASRKCAVILMHMRGGPADHMRFARYRDVVGEVEAYLVARAREAIRAGVARSRIILDPGLGFAKQPRHSLGLLNALPRLCALGYPILVGASRKGFVRVAAGTNPAALEFGTTAISAIAVVAGAAIVRVHDVASAVAAVKMAAAIKSSNGGG
ncbi:MAG TPA: dihydropteroate synthase [Candidatus Binataceae bacterium]|nr:dihydropteroate synthase [Candidatus Binataceae bacterium]